MAKAVSPGIQARWHTADWLPMWGRSEFAQVLDEKLRAFESNPASCPVPSEYGRRTAPANPFLFSQPYQSSTTPRYPRPARPADCRSPRLLASHEEQALAMLNRFGADLQADFTACELRSAFRVLVRRYHPDRHPASDHTEKARLARIVGEIVDHHRQLTHVTQ